MWSNFSLEDYRVNKRSFSRYVKMEKKIMERSKKYLRLPQTTDTRVIKKRKKTGYSSFSEESPVKKQMVLGDSTTDED